MDLNNMIWELAALIGVLTTAFLAMMRVLRSSIAINSDMSKNLQYFSEALQAHNRERETWSREREAWIRERETLRNELETIRKKASEFQSQLEAEITRLKEELRQERQKRQALEAKVQALRAELEHERAQRQKAERDKAELAAERDEIRQQLDSLRTALEKKADKNNDKLEHVKGEARGGTDIGAMEPDRNCSGDAVDGSSDAGSQSVAEQASSETGKRPDTSAESSSEQHPDAG